MCTLSINDNPICMQVCIFLCVHMYIAVYLYHAARFQGQCSLGISEKDRVNAQLVRVLVGTTQLYVDLHEKLLFYVRSCQIVRVQTVQKLTMLAFPR